MSLRARFCVIAATMLVATAAVAADDYPTRPIRVISPFPAGSASDTVSRVVLDQVSQIIGQPMVIETKPGAGGIVGFADVAKADPDGYTVVTSSTSLGTGSVLHSHLPYDPANDFAPSSCSACRRTSWSPRPRAASRRWPIWSRRRRRTRASSPLPPPASAPPRTWPASGFGLPPISTSATCRSAIRA